jgi:hypothetical protein
MDRRIFVTISLLLVSCGGAPTPEPTVESYPTIATTPELESTIVGWVIHYRQSVADAIITVKTYSPLALYDTLEMGESDLAIIGSPPPDGFFVTLLAHREVVLVTNLENRVQTLDRDDLQGIFSGKYSSWETITGEATPLQPVMPFEGDSTRTAFEQTVMQGSAVSPSTLLAPTPSIMLDLIREDTGAIGFMLATDVDDGARRLGIKVSESGAADEGGGEGLWIDVLAVSNAEPKGNLRDFIVWIQTNEIP